MLDRGSVFSMSPERLAGRLVTKRHDHVSRPYAWARLPFRTCRAPPPPRAGLILTGRRCFIPRGATAERSRPPILPRTAQALVRLDRARWSWQGGGPGRLARADRGAASVIAAVAVDPACNANVTKQDDFEQIKTWPAAGLWFQPLLGRTFVIRGRQSFDRINHVAHRNGLRQDNTVLKVGIRSEVGAGRHVDNR